MFASLKNKYLPSYKKGDVFNFEKKNYKLKHLTNYYAYLDYDYVIVDVNNENNTMLCLNKNMYDILKKFKESNSVSELSEHLVKMTKFIYDEKKHKKIIKQFPYSRFGDADEFTETKFRGNESIPVGRTIQKKWYVDGEEIAEDDVKSKETIVLEFIKNNKSFDIKKPYIELSIPSVFSRKINKSEKPNVEYIEDYQKIYKLKKKDEKYDVQFVSVRTLPIINPVSTKEESDEIMKEKEKQLENEPSTKPTGGDPELKPESENGFEDSDSDSHSDSDYESELESDEEEQLNIQFSIKLLNDVFGDSKPIIINNPSKEELKIYEEIIKPVILDEIIPKINEMKIEHKLEKINKGGMKNKTKKIKKHLQTKKIHTSNKYKHSKKSHNKK